ncbi:MAG: hypothetical protein GY711_31050 [bacterium]|nr:hypothetical protein [bacterium]
METSVVAEGDGFSGYTPPSFENTTFVPISLRSAPNDKKTLQVPWEYTVTVGVIGASTTAINTHQAATNGGTADYDIFEFANSATPKTPTVLDPVNGNYEYEFTIPMDTPVGDIRRRIFLRAFSDTELEAGYEEVTLEIKTPITHSGPSNYVVMPGSPKQYRFLIRDQPTTGTPPSPGPFTTPGAKVVQFGHTTPWMAGHYFPNSAADCPGTMTNAVCQASYKFVTEPAFPASPPNPDHTGIRFMLEDELSDCPNPSSPQSPPLGCGGVPSNVTTVAESFLIHFVIDPVSTAEHDQDFKIYDFMGTTELIPNGMGQFAATVPLQGGTTDTGHALCLTFFNNQNGTELPYEDLIIHMTGTTPVTGSGTTPEAGWNNTAVWTIEDRP